MASAHFSGRVVRPLRIAARTTTAERLARRAAVWGKILIAISAIVWAAGIGVGFERALLVLTLLGFGVAVVGFRDPVVGPLGVAMLCTLDPISRAYVMTGGLWRWNTFNYLLLAVIAVSVPFLLKQRHPSIRLLEALLLLLSLEILLSADRAEGAQHVLNLLVLLGLLVYLGRVGANPAVWYWMGSLSGVLAGLGGALFYIQRDRLAHINENAFSFFPLTAVFAISLAIAVPQRRAARKVLLLLGAVNAAWVFLSGSRGSLVITVVCFLFLVWRMAVGVRRLVWIAGVLAVGIVVASIFGESESRSMYRVEKLFDTRETLRARTSGRSELALGAWYIFVDHPLGVGTGGFSSAWARLGNAPGLTNYRKGIPAAAHSGWMKVLAENGVPGILLLMAFVSSFAVVGWVRRRDGLFALGLWVTTTLGVAFLADEFQGKALWLLAAGAVTLMNSTPQSHRRRIVDAGNLAPVRPARRAGLVASPAEVRRAIAAAERESDAGWTTTKRDED